MDEPRHTTDRPSRGAFAMAVSVSYVECDVADDATLRQWRRSRDSGRPAQRRIWRRMIRRAAVLV